MRRDELERLLILRLSVHSVGAAQALEHGHIQPRAFLELCSQYKPLAAQFRQLGQLVPVRVRRQRVGAQSARIATQNTRQHVEKGRFAITTAAVCNDELFLVDVPDGSSARHHLEILRQRSIAAGEAPHKVQPEGRARAARVHRARLGALVRRVIRSCLAGLEIHGATRAVQQKRIAVQLLRRHVAKVLCLAQCGTDSSTRALGNDEFYIRLGGILPCLGVAAVLDPGGGCRFDILAGLHDLRVSQGMEPAVRCCLIGCELAIVPHQPPQTGVIQHLACVAALEDTRLGKI